MQQLHIYYLSVTREAMGQALNFEPELGEERSIYSVNIERQSERKLKVLCD